MMDRRAYHLKKQLGSQHFSFKAANFHTVLKEFNKYEDYNG